MEKLPTKYAPAERASADAIEKQVKYFKKHNTLNPLLDTVPEILMVLNKERQIVYCNRAMYEFLGLEGPDKLYGLRTGEALLCLHALEEEGGCGTTEFCRTCGSVNAILSCLSGEGAVKECRITQAPAGSALDLRATSTPLSIDGEPYVVFALADISDEKRRQALEHLFFHDILNTAGGLIGATDMLNDHTSGEGKEFANMVQALALKLVDDVQAQRELLSAENDEIEVSPGRVVPEVFINQLVEMFRYHDAAQERNLVVQSGDMELALYIDESLLRRVVGNMIKNALEATPKGGRVSLGWVRDGSVVEFYVSNPEWMPEEVQRQVFQRSFSTKGSGRGLGTYSMKLLGEHYLGGCVTFDTSKENGTTFRARFPLNTTH